MKNVMLVETVTGKVATIGPNGKLSVDAVAGGRYRLVDEVTGKAVSKFDMKMEGDDLVITIDDLDAEIRVQHFGDLNHGGMEQSALLTETTVIKDGVPVQENTVVPLTAELIRSLDSNGATMTAGDYYDYQQGQGSYNSYDPAANANAYAQQDGYAQQGAYDAQGGYDQTQTLGGYDQGQAMGGYDQGQGTYDPQGTYAQQSDGFDMGSYDSQASGNEVYLQPADQAAGGGFLSNVNWWYVGLGALATAVVVGGVVYYVKDNDTSDFVVRDKGDKSPVVPEPDDKDDKDDKDKDDKDKPKDDAKAGDGVERPTNDDKDNTAKADETKAPDPDKEKAGIEIFSVAGGDNVITGSLDKGFSIRGWSSKESKGKVSVKVGKTEFKDDDVEMTPRHEDKDDKDLVTGYNWEVKIDGEKAAKLGLKEDVPMKIVATYDKASDESVVTYNGIRGDSLLEGDFAGKLSIDDIDMSALNAKVRSAKKGGEDEFTITGKADKEADVNVLVGDKLFEVKADADGKWEIKLSSSDLRGYGLPDASDPKTEKSETVIVKAYTMNDKGETSDYDQTSFHVDDGATITMDVVSGNNVVMADEKGLTLKGGSQGLEKDKEVEIFLVTKDSKGKETETSIGTTKIKDENGSWEFDPADYFKDHPLEKGHCRFKAVVKGETGSYAEQLVTVTDDANLDKVKTTEGDTTYEQATHLAQSLGVNNGLVTGAVSGLPKKYDYSKEVDSSDVLLPGKEYFAGNIAAMNDVRSFNGLDYVKLSGDMKYFEQGQKASLVEASKGKLSHDAKDYGTEDSDVAAALSTSILGMNTTIGGYMDDTGHDLTGHRVQIINPKYSEVAGGATVNDYLYNNFKTLGDSVMDGKSTAPQTVEWPAAGYFPKGLLPEKVWTFIVKNEGKDHDQPVFTKDNLSKCEITVTVSKGIGKAADAEKIKISSDDIILQEGDGSYLPNSEYSYLNFKLSKSAYEKYMEGDFNTLSVDVNIPDGDKWHYDVIVFDDGSDTKPGSGATEDSAKDSNDLSVVDADNGTNGDPNRIPGSDDGKSSSQSDADQADKEAAAWAQIEQGSLPLAKGIVIGDTEIRILDHVIDLDSGEFKHNYTDGFSMQAYELQNMEVQGSDGSDIAQVGYMLNTDVDLKDGDDLLEIDHYKGGTLDGGDGVDILRFTADSNHIDLANIRNFEIIDLGKGNTLTINEDSFKNKPNVDSSDGILRIMGEEGSKIEIDGGKITGQEKVGENYHLTYEVGGSSYLLEVTQSLYDSINGLPHI